MDTYRAFLAIIISFVILIGYQYLFVGFDTPQPAETTQTEAPSVAQQPQTEQPQPATPTVVQQPAAVAPAPVVTYDREPKDITVETDYFTAVISEAGGAMKSFVLKKHRATHDANSPGMELIKNSQGEGWPLQFSWGSTVPSTILYTAETESVHLNGDEKKVVRLVGKTDTGMTVEKIFSFDNSSYLVGLQVVVKNGEATMLQGMPQLQLASSALESGDNPANRFLFGGAATYVNGELEQIKAKKYKDGPVNFNGKIDWAGYESNYFLLGIMPDAKSGTSFIAQGTEELTQTFLRGNLDTLKQGAEISYNYKVFFGPKKQKLLKAIGHNLERAVYYGWFTPIAKPTLWLLNFFHSFVLNYGVSIILVTVLFKACFWPISQKGMKSMKNMQKLQPKMAKIKEKYKDDPTLMNKEVMNLYKTYKVNPLGGCLPMVLQIPVFFALYRVLLQSIELRHAPFMLWITDLSAPDRLWLGFNIPYTGGLPVLTLLMGASMFLQQKMSPTTADPTQAKIMMFLPVVFTFMFINFSSGLVLYWFVNNLLSILQQVLINRETNKKVVA